MTPERKTWNVALWVANDEALYKKACEYVIFIRENGAEKVTYLPFGAFLTVFVGKTTGDGVEWLDTELDLQALNEWLEELVPA